MGADRSWWWLLFGTLAAMVFASGKLLANLLPVQRIRVDDSGDGHFGSTRHGHTHQGVDLLVTPGEVVRSPLEGRVVRFTYPYAGDDAYRGIVLNGQGFEAKLFYVLPMAGLAPGDLVERGQPIATAQAISAKYGPPMLDHVHLELRTVVGAELVNPEHLLTLA